MPGAPFPTGTTYLGMTEDTKGPIETYTGVDHIAVRCFHPDIDSPLIGTRETAAANQGKLAIVSFKPVVGSSSKSHQQVAAGAIDGWLNAARDALKTYDGNLIVTYCPEMESSDEALQFGGGVKRELLGPYFRKAFNYVAKKLKDVNSSGVALNENVRMAPCFTGGWMDEIAAKKASASWAAAYYPGGEYVDYVASDPYNWRNCPLHQSTSRMPEQMVAGLIEFGHQQDKPVGIFETADIRNDRRPRWIEALGPTFVAHNRLKFCCWFEQSKECDFTLGAHGQTTYQPARGNDTASLNAYKALMQSDMVVTK